MSRVIAAALFLLMSGCVSLPPHNPAEAWVEVYSASYDSLMAETLDGKTWGPGSYYQVTPGAHTLGLSFQYPAGPRDAYPDSCSFSLAYDDFQAGKDYHLLAGWNFNGAWVHLLDEQGEKLASQTCNSPYGN
jgi:hypothetical protein